MLDYKLIQVLGNIYKTIDDEYLKSLLVLLFNSIKANDIKSLDLRILDLFDYSKIKFEYHSIKDSTDIIFELFDLNKYEFINSVRVNNGLGYDRDYLDKLYNELLLNKTVCLNNSRIDGLFNLLKDNNLKYNSIGLRIIIIRFLISINFNDLKVVRIENNRLNDKYSYLALKKGKQKNYTKLYFTNNDIILSTLLHDRVLNVCYTLKDNINYLYGANRQIENDDIFIDNLKNYQYEYHDNGIYNVVKYLYYLIDKLTVIQTIGFAKYDLIIDYNSIQVNDNNLNKYIQFFKKNYLFIQTDDLCLELYEKIESYLANKDEFESNDLKKDSIKKLENDDYYKYQINLSDYFLNP